MSSPTGPSVSDYYSGIGITQPAAPKPIIAQRAPLTVDTGYSIGQLWIDQANSVVYSLIKVSNSQAIWSALGYNLIPSFSVNLSSTIFDVTGDGTTVKVPFNNVIYDATSSYSISDKQFVAPRTGLYLFGCAIGLSDLNDAGFTTALLDITAGTNIIEQYFNIFATKDANNQCSLPFCLPVYLTANQAAFVDVSVSGGAKQVDIAGGSQFSGFFVA